MLCSACLILHKRPHLIFTSLLAKYLRNTSLSTFFNLGFDTLHAKEKSYSDFLKHAHQTSDLSHGKAIHAQLIKKSFIPNSTFLQNFLLNAYVKFGDFDSAVEVFDEMPQRNVVSWTSLISGFVRYGYRDEGLSYFSRMLRDDVRPNEFTFVSVLNACSFNGSVSEVHRYYALVIKLGFEWSVYITNALLTALIKNEGLMDAVNAFNECLDKDVVSWNAMISGYLQFSPVEIPGFWLRMIHAGMNPDCFTFATVFSGLGVLGYKQFGVQVHGQLVKYGHGSETCVGNSLVDMYVKFKDLDNGFKAFHEISCKNVLSWTAMATGCLSCGEPKKSVEVLAKMKRMNIRPNQFSLTTTFKACANMACLDEGMKAHGLRIKLGSEMDTCVDNALLDMYVKCGCSDTAMFVFKRMKHRTIVTWTTMLMGFAQNGQGQEALVVFDEMVAQGVKPNYITFVCVLYACSHAGFVDEGWKYFFSMTAQFGIIPGEDHYICMVDLLGRAGRINEAEQLISKMPVRPGPLIWQSLLGSCHIHGDIEAGNRAAASLRHLNQSSPSTYVTLSNMLAGLNDWEGAETLRDMMETMNINKNPGTAVFVN